MAKDAKPAVGSTFTVRKQHEFNDRGEIVARYLPGQSYRVTERNRAFVAGLDDAEFGPAAVAPVANRVGAVAGKVSGRVSVGSKRKR